MLSGEATHTNLVVFGLTQPRLEPTICRTRGKLNNYMYYTINLLLSMAPRKDHAKSRKSDLPYVINSLNILLYDVFRVKINVYSKTSVYLCYVCYYTQIKIRLVTFFFTNKVCKKVRYQNTLSPVNRRFVINHIAQ